MYLFLDGLFFVAAFAGWVLTRKLLSPRIDTGGPGQVPAVVGTAAESKPAFFLWVAANWVLTVLVVGGGLLLARAQGSDNPLFVGLLVAGVVVALLGRQISERFGVLLHCDSQTRWGELVADVAGIATVLVAVRLCGLCGGR